MQHFFLSRRGRIIIINERWSFEKKCIAKKLCNFFHNFFCACFFFFLVYASAQKNANQKLIKCYLMHFYIIFFFRGYIFIWMSGQGCGSGSDGRGFLGMIMLSTKFNDLQDNNFIIFKKNLDVLKI